MQEMRFANNIELREDEFVVDGVRISLLQVSQFLYDLTHPDPRKWYRLERVGDVINVTVRIAEDSDGSVIANAGHISE